MRSLIPTHAAITRIAPMTNIA